VTARSRLFPGTDSTSKSYASYVGAVNVTASSYGNSVSYTPEDQAYSAIDNNFDTAWITGTFVPDPKGEWWQSQFTNPVSTDHITLVQPNAATAHAGCRRSRSPSTARTPSPTT